MSGYTPQPDKEDQEWRRIVCTCGTTIALVHGNIMRYRCIDRRCRLSGQAKLVYIDTSKEPPEVVAEAYVPVKVETRSIEDGR